MSNHATPCTCGHPEIQHETREYRGDKNRHYLTEDCLCRRFAPAVPPASARAETVKRRVPEQFTNGRDRSNAQKAWLAGYDTARQADAEQIEALTAERDALARRVAELEQLIADDTRALLMKAVDTFKARSVPPVRAEGGGRG